MVSGVVLMGLTPHAVRAGSTLFESRLVEKTYVALVAGHLSANEGIVDYPIGKTETPYGYNKWTCQVPSNLNGTEAKHDQEVFIEGSLRHARTAWKVS